MPCSDMNAFRTLIAKAQHVVVITGAGISAASGVPTFRGPGGLWREFRATDLATPQAFARDPSLVWEFYHYRRELVLTKQPNLAHVALANYEKTAKALGKQCIVITQNIDELHRQAGTENLIELHGSLFKVRCTNCGKVSPNRDSPICAALKGRGKPEVKLHQAGAHLEQIAVKDLPSCKECDGLLRPHVVWFGEALEKDVLESAQHHLELCDLCLVVGTSSVVYPASMFAPAVAVRGVPVAEFNLEDTPATANFHFHFKGNAEETVPQAVSL